MCRFKSPKSPTRGRHKHLPSHQVCGYPPIQKKRNFPFHGCLRGQTSQRNSNHTRITVAGSQICYPGDVGTPTGSLDLVKLIINSVMSCRNARFDSFTAYCNQADLPMTSCAPVLRRRDITKPPQKLSSGAIIGVPSIFLTRWQLQHRICGQRTRPPYPEDSRAKLWDHHRLGGNKICRNWHCLRL